MKKICVFITLFLMAGCSTFHKMNENMERSNEVIYENTQHVQKSTDAILTNTHAINESTSGLQGLASPVGVIIIVILLLLPSILLIIFGTKILKHLKRR